MSLVFAHATNEVLVNILTCAGDELTRENIRDLAQNIDVQPTTYIDGVKFTSSPDDLDPIKTFQLIQFDGEKWVQLGAPITAE